MRFGCARVCFVAGLWLAAAVHTRADDVRSDPDATWVRAHSAVERGEALFAVGNYEAALVELESAYHALEGHSRQAVVLRNLAACHEHLFRYDDATRLYRRYLDEGGNEVDDRAEIEHRLSSLQTLLGTVSIESNVAAQVWVDDRNVGRAPGPIRVSPGRHLIELHAPRYEPARQQVVVLSGASVVLRFELESVSHYSGLSSVYFWTFAGLTVATGAVATGFGVAAKTADAQGRERARQDPFLNTVEDEAHVKHTALTADLLFAATALLGAGGVILFFVTDWDSNHPHPAQDASLPALTPYATRRDGAWEAGLRGNL